MTVAAPALVSRADAIAETRLLRGAFLAGCTLSVFGLVISQYLAMAGDAVALACATAVIFRYPPKSVVAVTAICATYLLVAIYLVDAMGSNWPGTYAALLGLRKALPPWLLLAAGLVWPPADLRWLTRKLVGLIAASLAVSILIHQFFPALEQGIPRSAADYTGEFDQKIRLEGIFAGPFHVGLAAMILTAAAVANPGGIFRFPVRATYLALAVVTLAEALVRSAIAGAAVVAVVALLAFGLPRGNARLARLVFGLGAALVGVTIINIQTELLGSNAALASFRNWESDQRLQNRLAFWDQARQMIESRPVFGWGAGSAGDTLDRYFPAPLQHVTSHDMFLKYAVETGLVGALAVIATLLGVAYALVRLGRSHGSRSFGLGLVAGLIAFGATGSAVDAVPVSGIAFFLIGLSVRSRDERASSLIPAP